MERTRGIITKTQGETARVLIGRESMCGENCGSCGLCDNSKTSIVAINEINALKGDLVDVEISTKTSFFAVVLTYCVSLFLFIAGIIVVGMMIENQGVALLSGVVLIIVWLRIVKFIFKGKQFNEKMMARIVSKVK